MFMGIFTKDIDLENLRKRYGMENSERHLATDLAPVSMAWALDGTLNTLEEFCMIWSFPLDRAKHLMQCPDDITHVEKLYLYLLSKHSYEFSVHFYTRWFMKAVYAARCKAKRELPARGKNTRTNAK